MAVIVKWTNATVVPGKDEVYLAVRASIVPDGEEQDEGKYPFKTYGVYLPLTGGTVEIAI